MSETATRVLIVDDEGNIREMLRRGLARAGYESSTAERAEQAAELLEGDTFDLVLLDITMPGKSGMDLLPEIVARHPDLAVVMLTGVADVATGVRAMREGASDYVNKPVALGDLVIRVENALSKRALVIQNRAYQQELERVVAELNRRQEQRQRELDALNKLFQSHLGEDESAQGSYSRLVAALRSFTAELEDLAGIAGLVGRAEPEAPAEPAARNPR